MRQDSSSSNRSTSKGQTLPRALVATLAGAALAVGLVGVPASSGRGAGSAGQRQAEVEIQQLRNRGKASHEEKLYAEAAETFARVVELPGATAQDHLNLALALYQNRDDEAAAAALDRVDEVPDHPGFAYLRGLIHKRAGRLEQSRTALERARELDPTDPAIRYNLGAVYAQLQREDEARAEFEAVIDMGFDVALQHYVSALYRHFQGLLRQGRRDAAAAEIELHREASQRLSEAARSPAALEQSRYSEIVVPNIGLVPARADTAAAVRLGREAPVGELPTGLAALLVDDLDGDGQPDIVALGTTSSVWLATAAGYRPQALDVDPGPAALGDFDRDGFPDLYVADASGDRLYRNVLSDGGDAAFVLHPASGLPAAGAPRAVLWVDHDHDGDLDVLVAHGSDSQGVPYADRLLRNQGGGAFADVTAEAGLTAVADSSGALWADLDGDRDIDLYRWGPSGTALYSNQRGGRFIENAAAVGATVPPGATSVVAEDFDNDGHIDLVLAAEDGLHALRNTGAGTFLAVDQEVSGAIAVGESPVVEVADWNNDGYLDLVVGGSDGVAFLVNAGDLVFRVFEPAEDVSVPAAGGVAALRPADADGDGALDLLTTGADGLLWLMQQEPAGEWVSVRATGIKNNVRGIGSTVEVKAGGHYQLRPLRNVPLHFGLGDARGVDVLRLRWPNGIVQNLTDTESGQVIATTELERLEGSCPFLYTWDGQRWHFVNEVLGVAPLGMPLADGVVHTPDPDEYVPVPGAALRARDGRLEIRLTEELRETGYVDAVRLVAVDHAASIEVLPDERFSGPPHPRFRLFAFDDPRPVEAVDQRGRDWTAALGRIDERWAIPFDIGPYDGLATPHSLTLTLPEAVGQEPVHLLLTGWVYWAMGSINLAVDQDPRYEFRPVTLEVPDGRGGWRVAIDDIGLPNAKNSTLILDLTPHLDRRDPRVRLSTTMRLYWDAARYVVGGDHPYGLVPVGDWQQEHGVPRPGPLELETVTGPASVGVSSTMPPAGSPPVRLHVLEPTAADVRFRGFSRLRRTADGFETFDYERIVEDAPWDQHPGRYTRYGTVDELVTVADDRYVVLGTGDELAIVFDEELPPVRSGWRREWLVYLNGWVKDGDMNTIYGDRVEPLPFHGMGGYPYGPGQTYPQDDAHRSFVERYLTRPARPINTPLRDGGR